MRRGRDNVCRFITCNSVRALATGVQLGDCAQMASGVENTLYVNCITLIQTLWLLV
jgi:hypothetical protein